MTRRNAKEPGECELPTTRSASALASPARTSSAICAIVKPCASIGDSVQQSCGQSAGNASGGGQGWGGVEHAGRMVPNVFSVPITVPVAIRLLLLKPEELDVSDWWSEWQDLNLRPVPNEESYHPTLETHLDCPRSFH